MEAIVKFETADAHNVFDPAQIKTWAANFSTGIFLNRMRKFNLSVAPEAEASMSVQVNQD
jgi:hypothetical protein